ncbi:MAG: proprotein convertase P-domain-containing protein [Planctomycetota bacterium]
MKSFSILITGAVLAFNPVGAPPLCAQAQSSAAAASALANALTAPSHATATGALPFGATVLNGPVALATLDAIDICYDAGGAVFGVPTVYVVDLTGGQTYLHNAATLALLGSIPNPPGNLVTGIATNGTTLYWAVDNQLRTSAMNGTNPQLVGPLAVPGAGGQVACITRAPNGDLWVVDNVNDHYSRHSSVNGAFLGAVVPNPAGSGAFGNGIAFRADCGLLAAPHGSLGSGQVTTISLMSTSGMVLASSPVQTLGSFINGIEAVAVSPSAGVPSLFVIENFTNSLYEIAAVSPCPVAPTDCHSPVAGGQRFAWVDLPAETRTSTPGLPIDSVFPTTTSNLSVAGVMAPIADLDCRVELTHTFVGDLDITVSKPAAGITVQLHDSAGTSSDDIHVVYDDEGRSSGAPFSAGDRMQPAGGALGGAALADFDGIDPNGSWQLAVTDNFAGENGTLVEWELIFSRPLAIPDNLPAGTAAQITVPASATGQIADLDLELAVTHPSIGQLVIELTSPQGTTVRVHNATGGASANLSARYDDSTALGSFNDGFGNRVPDGPGALRDFDLEPLAGDWTLQLADNAAGAVGSLTSFALRICDVDCSAPTGVTCSSSCTTGTVSLGWSNGQGYNEVRILRNGVLIATLPGSATSFQDPGLAAGSYEYEIRGDCSPGIGAATCFVRHAPFAGQSHFVFAGELPFGLVDSVSALTTALVANAANPLVIDDLTYPCFSQAPADSVLWLCLGTFPDNYVLTPADGVQLVNLSGVGVSIYLEGADVWGFDPITAFADHDGVENGTALDGNDGFVAMNGLAFSGLDLTTFAGGYEQDQDGSDFTDRLLATGTTAMAPVDLGGSNAAIVWRDATENYGTGVFYVPTGTAGRVLNQSWEFGGYTGNAVGLAAEYLSALGGVAGPPNFVRGNVNADNSINLLDAVTMLSYLFIPGSTVPPCLDAADVNDGGTVNLLDAVNLLSYLFIPMSPPPAAPFPNCGQDPNPDNLGCASFAPCP